MSRVKILVSVALFVVVATLSLQVSAGGAFAPRGAITARSELVRAAWLGRREPNVTPALPREIVFLHGNGERPEDGCHALRALLMREGYTRCPRGNLAFGGGYTWGGGAESMAAALDREESQEPAADALARPSVLVAFSQGGYVAPQVLAARRGRFSAALFIGANVQLSKVWLTSVGIQRVALAAGRWDMTSEAMRTTARRLAAEGVDARFFDLGNVGHTYFPKEPNDIAEIVAWLAGPAKEPT